MIRKAINEALYWMTCLIPWPIFYTTEQYDAALTVCHQKFHGLCIASLRELDGAEPEIARLRDWAKTLMPFDRRAYMVWLNFYERDSKRRRHEIEDAKRKQQFLDSGKFPKPPIGEASR